MRAFALLAILLATPCLASIESTAAKEDLTGLQAGKFKLGTSYEFHAGSPNISASLEYQFGDRFSLGVMGGKYLLLDPGASSWSFGPIASYTLWKSDRFAVYASGGVTLEHSSFLVPDDPAAVVHDRFGSILKVGGQVFIVPALSIGPSITWRHAFAGSANRISAAADIAVHF